MNDLSQVTIKKFLFFFSKISDFIHKWKAKDEVLFETVIELSP